MFFFYRTEDSFLVFFWIFIYFPVWLYKVPLLHYHLCNTISQISLSWTSPELQFHVSTACLTFTFGCLICILSTTWPKSNYDLSVPNLWSERPPPLSQCPPIPLSCLNETSQHSWLFHFPFILQKNCHFILKIHHSKHNSLYNDQAQYYFHVQLRDLKNYMSLNNSWNKRKSWEINVPLAIWNCI